MEKGSEVGLRLGALLRDVEVAGDVFGKTATRIHDGVLRDTETGGETSAHRHFFKTHRRAHLEQQLPGALGAVAQVHGAEVLAPPTSGLQQVGAVQQDGVERVDADAAGHKQQVHSWVGGGGVKEEVPAHTHGYLGAYGALGW